MIKPGAMKARNEVTLKMEVLLTHLPLHARHDETYIKCLTACLPVNLVGITYGVRAWVVGVGREDGPQRRSNLPHLN
jgi:hypothetical protein